MSGQDAALRERLDDPTHADNCHADCCDDRECVCGRDERAPEAVRNVLDLHRSHTSEPVGHPWCWTCGPSTWWPCATVRAVARGLGLTVSS